MRGEMRGEGALAQMVATPSGQTNEVRPVPVKADEPTSVSVPGNVMEVRPLLKKVEV